jgi:hypothetical protein
MQLSKSDYITYLKHPAWLWLKKHRPDMLPQPDENTQAIIDEGKLFEKYAEQIFPDAIKLKRSDFFSVEEWANKTKDLIDQRVGTILQAAFIYDDYLCISDALQYTADGYSLIEIKATTSPDKEHICDLAFQKAVIEYTGVPIAHTMVLHANKDYVRHGDIKLDELVMFSDVTGKVNKEVLEATGKMRDALAVVGQEEMPSDSLRHVGLGAAGDWREIFSTLHPEIEPYSIYDLASCKGSGTDKLIATFEDGGIRLIVDIPDSIKLQTHQKDQVCVTKNGNPIVDTASIKKFISEIEFPIYFLDYETINLIMPPFDNTWPYQQVVFQHSIHILQEDGTLKHEEYLHDTNDNPAPHVIESLERIIGNKGSIIVWNESFEKSRHKDLAKLYPAKAEFLENLNNRVIDLMEPFGKRMYQDMRQKGSASIKKVLPLLCPELSYKILGIQEGGTASRSWREAIIDGKRDDKEKILSDLREYCGLDTYAMVAIYRVLKSL